MENIERKSVYTVGKHIFENEEDARDYLKSCDVNSEVVMPFRTEDIERYQDLEELGITDEEFEDWENYNLELAYKYSVVVRFIKYSYEGPKYELSGTYKNLLKFAKEYASHPTLDNIGDWRDDIMEGITKYYTDSGKEYYIIGELY